MLRVPYFLFILTFIVSPVHAQDALLSRSDIRTAIEHIERNYNQYLQKQIEISEIPAPPSLRGAGRAKKTDTRRVVSRMVRPGFRPGFCFSKFIGF